MFETSPPLGYVLKGSAILGPIKMWRQTCCNRQGQCSNQIGPKRGRHLHSALFGPLARQMQLLSRQGKESCFGGFYLFFPHSGPNLRERSKHILLLICIFLLETCAVMRCKHDVQYHCCVCIPSLILSLAITLPTFVTSSGQGRLSPLGWPRLASASIYHRPISATLGCNHPSSNHLLSTFPTCCIPSSFPPPTLTLPYQLFLPLCPPFCLIKKYTHAHRYGSAPTPRHTT